MIRIKPSQTADTRTCDFANVSKDTLRASSAQHIVETSPEPAPMTVLPAETPEGTPLHFALAGEVLEVAVWIAQCHVSSGPQLDVLHRVADYLRGEGNPPATDSATLYRLRLNYPFVAAIFAMASHEARQAQYNGLRAELQSSLETVARLEQELADTVFMRDVHQQERGVNAKELLREIEDHAVTTKRLTERAEAAEARNLHNPTS